MSFTSFHLHRQLEAGVKALGYNKPTPIQRQAALDGFRDGSYQVLVATDIAARGEERHPPDGPLPAPVPLRKIIRSDRQAELLIVVPFLTTPPVQRPSGTLGQVRILAKPNQ